MNFEIAGHEFFSADGKWIWYDLQTPRGQVFWIAGHEIATGKKLYRRVEQNEWSVHYNVAPDGKLFAGDGGDEDMVAHAKDGKWIYAFRPETIRDAADPVLHRRPDHRGQDGQREAGRHVGPRLSARAEPDLHARSEVDRVHLQHAWRQPRLCRGGRQGLTLLPP
jgi:hypothetical protein